ncbi:hypothetical protein JHK87_055417 [Glycine soja]|nr:hypothetical protein JHK87_055417 [Glycine soja]
MEEVIFSDKDENVSIIFPEMECLVLEDLPKLVKLCRQNRSFDWPNLQTMRTNNIPSMETFSRGNLNTPLLRSVHITFAKKVRLGNLNKAISYMHKNPALLLQRGRPVPLGPIPMLHDLSMSIISTTIFVGLLFSAAEIKERWWLWQRSKTLLRWLLCFPLGTHPSGHVPLWDITRGVWRVPATRA